MAPLQLYLHPHLFHVYTPYQAADQKNKSTIKISALQFAVKRGSKSVIGLLPEALGMPNFVILSLSKIGLNIQFNVKEILDIFCIIKKNTFNYKTLKCNTDENSSSSFIGAKSKI